MAEASEPECARVYIIGTMKAHVYVTLKQTVLDPQGQAIHNALRKDAVRRESRMSARESIS